MIDAEDEERIASALLQLRDGGGPQMAVVFVRTTEGQPIEDYAMRVAEMWGGGSKERDDGIVLLFAIGDRRSRLEVGYGLEAKLPDAKSRTLLDGAKDDLRAERYGEAALRVIRDVAAATGRPAPIVAERKAHYPTTPPQRPEAESPSSPRDPVVAAPPPRTVWWQSAPFTGLSSFLAGILAGVLGTLLLRRAAPREVSVHGLTDDELTRAIRAGLAPDWRALARWTAALSGLLVAMAGGALLFPTKTFVPFGGFACVFGFAAALFTGGRESPLKALIPTPVAIVWGIAGFFSFGFEGVFSTFFGAIATLVGSGLLMPSSGSTSVGSGAVRYGSSSSASFGSSSSIGFSSSSFGASTSSSSSSSSSSTGWSGGGGGFGGGGASSSW